MTICTLNRGIPDPIDSECDHWVFTQCEKLKEMGYNIERFTFPSGAPISIKDFSQMRNEMDRLVKTEWVLHLDSDEYIHTKDLIWILEHEDKFDKYNAYGFHRHNYFVDYEHLRTDSGCYPDTQYRLYNKNHYKWEGKVHESVRRKDIGEFTSYVTVNLPMIAIHHFSFLKPADFQVQKHARFHELRGLESKWKFPEFGEVTVRKVPNIKKIIEEELK